MFNLIRKILFFGLLLSLSSCEIKLKDGREEVGSTYIRNNIQLNSTKLNVEQAFLVFNDGTLVPENNKVQIKQEVNLKLLVSGWVLENNKYFPEASLRIETSDGRTIVTADSLYYKTYPDGQEFQKDNFVILTAWISKLDKLYDYFLVSFHVWDKKGRGEIKGSYKLHV